MNSDYFPRLKEVIEDKVKNYDPSKTGEETSDFTTTDSVGFWTIATRHVPASETGLVVLGLFSTIVFAAGLPGFCLIFGEMIDDVGGSQGLDALRQQALIMVYLGLGVWFVAWGMISCMEAFAVSHTFRMKKLYFKAILEKDSAWFDEHVPSELTANIAK